MWRFTSSNPYLDHKEVVCRFFGDRNVKKAKSKGNIPKQMYQNPCWDYLKATCADDPRGPMENWLSFYP